MKLYLLTCALVLTACAAAPPETVSRSLSATTLTTEVARAHAKASRLGDGPNTRWAVQADVVDDNGTRLDIVAAYAEGGLVPFITDRDGGGQIPMTRAHFERLAVTGLSLHLETPDGGHDITLPPAAFRAALTMESR